MKPNVWARSSRTAKKTPTVLIAVKAVKRRRLREDDCGCDVAIRPSMPVEIKMSRWQAIAESPKARMRCSGSRKEISSFAKHNPGIERIFKNVRNSSLIYIIKTIMLVFNVITDLMNGLNFSGNPESESRLTSRATFFRIRAHN